MKLVVTQLGQVPPAQSEVASGIAAQPGGQAGATVLTARVNVITVVAPGTAVRVSIVNGRYRQDVSNRSGEDLPVFPPVGHGFVGQAVNTAVTLADGDDAVFLYRGAETWGLAWTGGLSRDQNLGEIADPDAAWENLGGSDAGKLSVGAGLTAASGALTADVRSVAGRTGVVTIAASDVAGLGNAATRNVGTAAGSVAAGDDARIVGAAAASAIGQPSGIASLGSDGRLTPTQVPSGLTSGTTAKGLWDATANTPTLASGVGTNGDMWAVSVAGTTALDGEAVWGVGDQLLFSDGAWRRIPLSTVIASMALTSLASIGFSDGATITPRSRLVPGLLQTWTRNGDIAGAIRDNGELWFALARFGAMAAGLGTFTGVNTTDLAATSADIDLATILEGTLAGVTYSRRALTPGWLHLWKDGQGNGALGVRPDGLVEIASAKVKFLEAENLTLSGVGGGGAENSIVAGDALVPNLAHYETDAQGTFPAPPARPADRWNCRVPRSSRGRSTRW